GVTFPGTGRRHRLAGFALYRSRCVQAGVVRSVGLLRALLLASVQIVERNLPAQPAKAGEVEVRIGTDAAHDCGDALLATLGRVQCNDRAAGLSPRGNPRWRRGVLARS